MERAGFACLRGSHWVRRGGFPFSSTDRLERRPSTRVLLVRAQRADLLLVHSILLAQFTITGFDASAHMAEETADAGRAAPRGVLISVGSSACFGLFYLLSLLFSMPDYQATLDSSQPVLHIFTNAFGKTGGSIAFSFIILCVTLCGTFSVTSNSRMVFAFARDAGLPRWFDKVEARTGAPIRTVWLSVVLAFCLALPSLGSVVAFTAVTSIATMYVPVPPSSSPSLPPSSSPSLPRPPPPSLVLPLPPALFLVDTLHIV